jgi:hypothetical protein
LQNYHKKNRTNGAALCTIRIHKKEQEKWSQNGI